MIFLFAALIIWLLIGLRYTMTITSTITIDNASYINQQNTVGSGIVGSGLGYPISKALTGVLSTRSSNTAGVLTMQTGHGLVEGDIISVFWVVQTGQATAGQLTTVTVGTVTVNLVDITCLSGSVLPAVNSNITGMIPQQYTLDLNGEYMQALFLSCDSVPGFVTLSEANGTVLVSFELLPDAQGTNFNYNWTVNSGLANPLQSGSSYGQVGLVLFSHGDSTASHTMIANALYND